MKELSPVEFSTKYTREYVDSICQIAGTTLVYWRLILNRRKRPSYELALRLVFASGGELRLEGEDGLLFPRASTRKTGSPPLFERTTKRFGKQIPVVESIEAVTA